MCQQGYGSSVLSLSKSIKCKMKPKSELMQYSVQSLKKSDHLRAVVKFFLLFFYFAEKIKIKKNAEGLSSFQSLVGTHKSDASHHKLKPEYVLARDI